MAGSFDKIAPVYMRKLMNDFDVDLLSAAAVFGNAGYESNGFRTLQEISPTIPGSEGGWGWFQWTGPRRDDFEDYARRNGYDLSAPETNYKWLFLELLGAEKAAIPALMYASTLEEKVVAFEETFERAGIKRYPERIKWAKRALKAYNDMYADVETPAQVIARIRADLDLLERLTRR
jgi:hypothetical protein